MIEYKVGDVLSEKTEALVNTVNCVGVMGRGVALQFKKAFPENFKAYSKACKQGEVEPGRMFVHETERLDWPRYIINFPTKRHWRGKSRISDVESGLAALVEEIQSRGIRSIALPPLGSGLGGLNWDEVRERIEAALGELSADVQVVVFEPSNSPDPGVMARLTEVPAMTPGRAALVMLMHRYLGALLDPFVTLLEVHKLMYFLAETGEPLQLYYKKAPYGPFAENMSHVLHAVEGHFISGYLDGGDAPDKRLNIVPGAVAGATEFLTNDPGTNERLNKVIALVDGFETPFGLELLATVHWVITKEEATTVEDVIQRTYNWNSRKRMFYSEQIALACEVLESKGWLPDRWRIREGEQFALI